MKLEERNIVRILELSKVRGKKLKEAYKQAEIEAAIEFELLKGNQLFVAGLMLYWGEGDKRTKHHVKLTNTDPDMIRIFTKFLADICGIPHDRIRGNIILYPDIDQESSLNFWSDASGLSSENFSKSTVIKGKHPTRRLENGVCMVNVSSTYLKHKILIWLRLLARELIDKQYYENI